LKEHKCESCNLSDWLGKPIPLELHHIDGDRKNNCIDNLQLLCLNYHGLTNNYSGKANKKPVKHWEIVMTNLETIMQNKGLVETAVFKYLETEYCPKDFGLMGNPSTCMGKCIPCWLKALELKEYPEDNYKPKR